MQNQNQQLDGKVHKSQWKTSSTMYQLVGEPSDQRLKSTTKSLMSSDGMQFIVMALRLAARSMENQAAPSQHNQHHLPLIAFDRFMEVLWQTNSLNLSLQIQNGVMRLEVTRPMPTTTLREPPCFSSSITDQSKIPTSRRPSSRRTPPSFLKVVIHSPTSVWISTLNELMSMSIPRNAKSTSSTKTK